MDQSCIVWQIKILILCEGTNLLSPAISYTSLRKLIPAPAPVSDCLSFHDDLRLAVVITTLMVIPTSSKAIPIPSTTPTATPAIDELPTSPASAVVITNRVAS